MIELPESLRNLAKIKAFLRKEVQKTDKNGETYSATEIDQVDFDIHDILQIHPIDYELVNLPMIYFTIVALATESRNLYDDLYAQYLTWEAVTAKEGAQNIGGRVTEQALSQIVQTHPDYLQKRYELNAAKKLWRMLWFGAKTALEIKAQLLSVLHPEAKEKLEKIMNGILGTAEELSAGSWAGMEDGKEQMSPGRRAQKTADGDSIPPDDDDEPPVEENRGRVIGNAERGIRKSSRPIKK